MNCPKDFLGNELKVGDNIVFIHRRYQELRKGVILKLNPKQATILDVAEQGKINGKYDNVMGFGKTCRSYNCIIKT